MVLKSWGAKERGNLKAPRRFFGGRKTIETKEKNVAGLTSQHQGGDSTGGED